MKFLNLHLLVFLFVILGWSCNGGQKQATGSKTDPIYLTKEVIAAYVAAIAAFGMGGLSYYQFKITRKDQKKNFTISREDQKDSEIDRTLWDALKWFESGTQKRSIGIAVIEAYWRDEKRKDIKKTWIPLLINQAVHILRASDGKDKATEQVNLERIIKLLKSTPLAKSQKEDIRNTLLKANFFDDNDVPQKVSDAGIYIKKQQRDTWIAEFPDN